MIADRLERTLSRMLELYELAESDRDRIAKRVAECHENIASMAHAVQVFQADCEKRVGELAIEVAECVRRVDHVHGQALRALTAEIQPKGAS